MQIENPCDITLPSSLFGGGLILPYEGFAPEIGENVFIAPFASVIGQIFLGENVSVWFGSTIRGDISCIRVGDNTNIQDQCVLHVGDNHPCIIGNNVVAGHKAVMHGCTVEDDCLIGIGAVILNGAIIGQGSIIGAGSLIPENACIPPSSVVMGTPGKVIRQVTEEEHDQHAKLVDKYVGVARKYMF